MAHLSGTIRLEDLQSTVDALDAKAQQARKEPAGM